MKEIKKIILSGQVKVNQVNPSVHHWLRSGDLIEYEANAPELDNAITKKNNKITRRIKWACLRKKKTQQVRG